MLPAEPRKIALVTGGATGIGAAICRSLAEANFLVGIHCNQNRASADKLAGEIQHAFVVQADLSTTAGCDSLYDYLRSEHNSQLDVLVNNAGLAIDNPIFSATVADFDSTINVNMRATWYLTKRLSRLMIRQKQGRVINISSVVGSTGNPAQSIYGMTKAAIDNFTHTAAAELAGHGILVNSVAPGFIATDMTAKIPAEFQGKIMERIPLGRMGTPHEVADVVRFLSTSATYMTGSVVHVNGGMYG